MTALAQTDEPNARSVLSSHRAAIGAAILIFVFGIVIRLTVDFGFKGTSYDEAIYRSYINMVDKVGLMEYAGVCERYLIDQRDPDSEAKLPPTRFLYVLCGWLTKYIVYGNAPPANVAKHGEAVRDPFFKSLHHVSLIFSILNVGLCGLAAWRMFGAGVGLGAMALSTVSPLAIHMGKHALIDGFFAFWATLCIWLLWENLQRPNNPRWLIAFGSSLALMVMTKENAFFVYVALCGIVTVNRWFRFGTVTHPLLFVGILGPLFGVVLLVTLAGGLGTFVEIYKLLVTKAQNLTYAITTGDGPWFRYLLELTIVDPIVFVLAVTGLFTLPPKNRAFGYLLTFVVISYTIMCKVPYAMNVRYTMIWALPLTAFASAQILHVASFARRYALIAAVLLTAGIAAFNLRQYQVFFVEHAIYEPVPTAMLRAIKIVKDMPMQ